MDIKKEFEKIINERKETISKYGIGAEHGDYFLIRKLLSQNYDEVTSFLKNATIEEIAVAIEELDNLVEINNREKAQTILEIFKQKLIEFPNIQDYCEFIYEECLDEAQLSIDQKTE